MNTPPNEWQLTRRSILGAGTFVTVNLLIPRKALASRQRAPKDTHAASDAMRLLTPDGTGAYELPRTLGITSAQDFPSGAIITFEYSPEVYDILQVPVIRSPKGEAIRAAIASHSPGNTTIRLGHAVPAGSTIISGTLRPRVYPYDLMRNVNDPTAKTERAAIPLSRTINTKTQYPWAAEAGALWQEIRWDHDFRYFAPISASVRSTGFGPIPGGGEITISADRRILRDMQVDRATTELGETVEGQFEKKVDGGRIVGKWVISEPIPAGRQVLLEIHPNIAILHGEILNVSLPTIEFSAESQGNAPQRLSPKSSITRRDVVCDAATVQQNLPL